MPEELTILTFLFDDRPKKWKELGYSPYGIRHVNALYRACIERVKIPHRFVCVTNQSEGIECETIPLWPKIVINGHDSCYLRLRCFDPEFQKSLGTPYIACLDLDVVLMRDCTETFRAAMKHDFACLKGSHYPNGKLCSYYNGGFWICKVGARPQFWETIQLPNAGRLREGFRMPNGRRALGSDQAWLSVISGDREAKITPDMGAVQYRYGVSSGSTMVFFAGKTKPWDHLVQRKSPEIYAEWARFAGELKLEEKPVIVSWRWTDPKCRRRFPSELVNTHRSMIDAHTEHDFRYVCITDDPAGIDGETFPLWNDHGDMMNSSGSHLPSCFRRLKIFDPAVTRSMGIVDGTPVVSLDLDVVAIKMLDPLFERRENFVGWKVPGGRHRAVLNGTIFMHRAGTMENVYSSFNKRSHAQAKAAGYFGTDQGWMSYILVKNCAGWDRRDGILSFSSDVRLTGKLPDHARLVSFHGRRKPWDPDIQSQHPWIKQHWRQVYEQG